MPPKRQPPSAKPRWNASAKAAPDTKKTAPTPAKPAPKKTAPNPNLSSTSAKLSPEISSEVKNMQDQIAELKKKIEDNPAPNVDELVTLRNLLKSEQYRAHISRIDAFLEHVQHTPVIVEYPRDLLDECSALNDKRGADVLIEFIDEHNKLVQLTNIQTDISRELENPPENELDNDSSEPNSDYHGDSNNSDDSDSDESIAEPNASDPPPSSFDRPDNIAPVGSVDFPKVETAPVEVLNIVEVPIIAAIPCSLNGHTPARPQPTHKLGAQANEQVANTFSDPSDPNKVYHFNKHGDRVEFVDIDGDGIPDLVVLCRHGQTIRSNTHALTIPCNTLYKKKHAIPDWRRGVWAKFDAKFSNAVPRYHIGSIADTVKSKHTRHLLHPYPGMFDD